MTWDTGGWRFDPTSRFKLGGFQRRRIPVLIGQGVLLPRPAVTEHEATSGCSSSTSIWLAAHSWFQASEAIRKAIYVPLAWAAPAFLAAGTHLFAQGQAMTGISGYFPCLPKPQAVIAANRVGIHQNDLVIAVALGPYTLKARRRMRGDSHKIQR